MVLKNLTKNKILATDAKYAQTILDKCFGLLIPSNPRTLIFKTRFGIHTFGLNKPIDVMVLDSKLKVICIKKSLPKNQFYFWNPKFDTVIELVQNTLQKSGTTRDDLISISW